MRFTLAPVLAIAATLVTSVLADGLEIQAAIADISEKTITLNTTVASWDGKFLGTLPIVGQSTELLFTIHKGTKVAESSANLTFIEAVTIAGRTSDLGKVVISTLNTIQAAKPQFKKLALTPAILLNLIAERDATVKFGEAVISKVPEPLQPLAGGLLTPISEAFERAIEDYKKIF